MIKKRFLIIGAFWIVSWIVSPAHAADVIDQQQPALDPSANPSAIDNSPNSEQKLAQSFTVGINGRLREIQIPVGCASGRLRLEIVGLDSSGMPSSTVLASNEVNARRLNQPVGGSGTAFLAIQIRGRLDVTTGQKLAFVLRNDSGSCGMANGPAGDTYSGGEAFYDARPNRPGWIRPSAGSPLDYPFKTIVRTH
jgi:hypothetical protein